MTKTKKNEVQPWVPKHPTQLTLVLVIPVRMERSGAKIIGLSGTPDFGNVLSNDH